MLRILRFECIGLQRADSLLQPRKLYKHLLYVKQHSYRSVCTIAHTFTVISFSRGRGIGQPLEDHQETHTPANAGSPIPFSLRPRLHTNFCPAPVFLAQHIYSTSTSSEAFQAFLRTNLSSRLTFFILFLSSVFRPHWVG